MPAMHRPTLLLSCVLLAFQSTACSDSPSGPDSEAIAAVEVSGPGSVEGGSTIQLSAVARTHGGALLHGPFEWRSTNESIATVDSTGRVTGARSGLVVIVATIGEIPGRRRVAVIAPPRLMTAVSGNDQDGKVGTELAEPLVVRVTNVLGDVFADVQVSWRVTMGQAVLDGRWVDPGVTLEVAVRTDADGYARMSVLPLSFSEITIEASALGTSPVTFTTDATDPEAALQIISGNHQDRIAAPIPIGGEPLVVRLTNGAGEPVFGVVVEWQLDSGNGTLFSPMSNPRTDSSGVSYVEFQPTSFGTSIVRASVPGISGPPATFVVNATVLQVQLIEEPWTGTGGWFWTPGHVSEVTVPVGGVLEFWNRLPTAHIRSTSAPSGSAGFDSGVLGASSYFRFVPDAVGVWKFRDEVTGATGTLRTTLAIGLTYDPWLDEVLFLGPESVPLGTAVEFVNAQPTARVVSTASPPGGAAFDSDTLAENDSFVFLPTVTGTWHFVDQVSGATGSFTVQ